MRKTSRFRKSEGQFALLLGVGVAILFVITIYSLVRGSDHVAVLTSTSSRQPASVSAESSPGIQATQKSKSNKKASASLALGCDWQDKKGSTHEKSIRLIGSSECWSWHDLHIINVTNGFSASLIETPGNAFTTDFIDLKEGENRLTISGTLSDGSKISKVLLVSSLR